MKGLSQILYLIIAAAVLTFVGLVLMYMFTSSTPEPELQSCLSSVDNACETGAETVRSPSICYNQEGDPLEGAPSYIPPNEGEEVQCSNVN